MQAVDVIHAEHRTLAAVLHGMLYLVRDIRYGKGQPNFDVLEAMVHYIHAFPERYHHPKEEAYLFRILRMRSPDTAPLLDRLQAEHRAGVAKVGALDQALLRYRKDGTGSLLAPFAAAAGDFAAFHWSHARTEEDEVIPLAKAFLTAAEWEEIDAAFAGHCDPLLGAAGGAEYEKLFRRIIDLAPPPLGVRRDAPDIE